MAEVVIALDFSGKDNYTFEDMVSQWFIEGGAKMDEDSFSLGQEVLTYNKYQDFNVVIFNFDNLDGDYFSELFFNYLNSLQDTNKIRVSLAEDGQFGFETLVATSLDKFLEMLNNAEGDESDE